MGCIIHLLDGRVLLFTSQIRTVFNGLFLSISGCLNFIFGCWLSDRRWIDGIDCVHALTLLSGHISVVACSVNGILSCICGILYLRLGSVFLFLSQTIISLDGCLLSVGCILNGLLSSWLSHLTWVDRINRVHAAVLLSFHCIVISCLVDGVFGCLSSCVHLSDGIRLLFIGQSVIGLDGILLSTCCIFDGLFSCWLSRWGLWHIVDGLRALGLLSSNIFIGCCCVDSILSLSCFSVNLGLGCILLLTSQSIISFDRGLLSIGCLVDGVLGISFRCWRVWNGVDCVLAGVFLSCHVLVSGCCIDGILSFLGFFVHLSFGCILLLTS